MLDQTKQLDPKVLKKQLEPKVLKKQLEPKVLLTISHFHNLFHSIMCTRI